MAQFNVYDCGGTYKAERTGWCWGGFLFGWLWAVVNGLWLYAIGHFIFFVVYFQIYSAIYNQSSVALLSIIGLSVPLVYGVFGNQWLGAKTSNGGTVVGTFDASSKEGAVMLYMQQQQLNAANRR